MGRAGDGFSPLFLGRLSKSVVRASLPGLCLDVVITTAERRLSDRCEQFSVFIRLLRVMYLGD
jgi:hypothetical protein